MERTRERHAGLLLGIDVGTYESKGVLVTAAGSVVATSTQPHGLSIPKPGWAEHDAEAIWWRDTVAICRDLLARTGVDPRRILAICCSAIAPTMVPIDHEGVPLRPAILYGIDTRTVQQIDELNAELGVERIFERTGKHLSTQSFGPKVRWFQKNEPELHRRTTRVLTASSYLVYKLTGEFAVDYYTAAASFEPVFDLKHLDWSSDLAGSVLPREWLPRLAWSGEVVGAVMAGAAEETGLAPGTPVVAGSADAASEAVSVGAIQPRDLMVMYGSTTFFIEPLEQLVTTPKLWSSVFLEEGTYALAAGMATTGAVTRWLRDEFAVDLTSAESGGGNNSYDELVKEAARVPPGADGLVALPYFSGERTPIQDPLARGMVAGLALYHTRGHLFRALLEGIAYGVRHHIEVMEDHDVAPSRLVAVGGGTRNPVWLQVVSDVTGLVQHVPNQQTGAAYGDAFLASIGAGVSHKLADVGDWVHPGRTIEPNPSNAELYDELYGIYRRLYEATRDDMHRLARMDTGDHT